MNCAVIFNDGACPGKPHPIVISSPADGRSAYYYNLVWENPDTGGDAILQYEFSIREVSYLLAAIVCAGCVARPKCVVTAISYQRRM